MLTASRPNSQSAWCVAGAHQVGRRAQRQRDRHAGEQPDVNEGVAPRGQPRRREVRVEVPGQERELEERDRRGPDRGAAAQDGQEPLGDERLEHEQQRRRHEQRRRVKRDQQASRSYTAPRGVRTGLRRLGRPGAARPRPSRSGSRSPPLLAFALDGRLGRPMFAGFLRLDAATVVALQTFRIGGVFFVIAWLRGSLPAGFALPAGLGDIAVGITAPFVAAAIARRTPHHRAVALVWKSRASPTSSPRSLGSPTPARRSACSPPP